MMLIDAAAAYVAIIFCSIVYFVMKKRKMYARWADARRGILLHLIRTYLYKLSNYEETGRTWRPNLLVLSGSPTTRWYLIELADAISHGKGFLTVCTILKNAPLSKEKIKSIEDSTREFLEKKGVPALTKVKISENIYKGVQSLISDYGLGSITPNTLMFGETGNEENFAEFAELIKMVYASDRNLLIVLNPKITDKPANGTSTSNGEANGSGVSISTRKGVDRVIDVWWGPDSKTSYLMLALSYLLQTSPEWFGSTLRVRCLVKDEDERQGMLGNLKQLNELSRLEADIQVIVRNEDQEPLAQMSEYSKGTDLTFIGMKAPDPEEEDHDAYRRYYQYLIEHTQNFPTTVLTLAGERIHFEEIFKE